MSPSDPHPGWSLAVVSPFAVSAQEVARRLGVPTDRVRASHGSGHEGGPAWWMVRSEGVAARVREQVRERVADLGDTVLVPPALVDAPPALVVTDVDSTLITQEVIEELAEAAGTRERVAAVTARAMNGEIDFEESLRERVATLEGVPAAVFADVLARIRPTPGAQRLVDAVHAAGGHFGVVSGGFEEVVGPLCARMGIDHHVANHLEVRDSHLTGRVLGEVVTAAVKVRQLEAWCDLHGVGPGRSVAVGDGANDVPMMRAAGLGIAFCAKPAVRAAVPDALSLPRLDLVAAVLGLS